MIQVKLSKKPSDILDMEFDFLSNCNIGEFVRTCQVISQVHIGVDPQPEVLLIGLPTIVRNTVHQTVANGVAGVVYKLSAAGRTNFNNVFVVEIPLAIVPENGLN